MQNLVFIISFIKGLYLLLLLFQQDHYQTTSIFRYLKTYFLKTPFIVITYLSIFFLLENIYINIVIYFLIFLVSLIPSRYIIKLKITKRMIRLIITNSLLLLGIFLINRSTLIIIIALLLLPLIVFISNLIILPIEILICKYYKNKAVKVLKSINPYIICITGSFGKTTLKNILYELYNPSYLTVKTPASYNTPMGISKTILNDLNPLTELFIVEAGATKPKDIKEITEMINPNLGVITQVGPQHLKSFKTMDNILKTKWELATYMQPTSKIILNYESKFLEGLTAYNLAETITTNTLTSNYYYTNVKTSNLLTEFDICENGNRIIHIKTKMLGLHNIQHIVMAYALKKTLDQAGFYLSDQEFKIRILNITNPKNRLSVKEENIKDVTFRYLDDSYNSNQDGFISAVKTLKSLDGIKVLITPGIVDTGKYEKSIVEKITPYLKDLDDLILIDNKCINLLTQMLKEKHISYLIFSSLKEAINFIKDKYSNFKQTKINILLENDLPDNYLKR